MQKIYEIQACCTHLHVPAGDADAAAQGAGCRVGDDGAPVRVGGTQGERAAQDHDQHGAEHWNSIVHNLINAQKQHVLP
jgi:hypothetical protein